eukprot:6176369-Pleurochrysis_carterae.AAC.1
MKSWTLWTCTCTCTLVAGSEEISAKRVLCDVLLGGVRVIHIRVGGVGGESRVRLPVVGCDDVVVVSPWAAITAEGASWSHWAMRAWQ